MIAHLYIRPPQIPTLLKPAPVVQETDDIDQELRFCIMSGMNTGKVKIGIGRNRFAEYQPRMRGLGPE